MRNPLAVLFRVAGTVYAIPCLKISEVVPLVALHVTPKSPEWLVGSLAHRGTLIPVIDMSRLIGDYACPVRLSSRIVLVNCGLPEERSQVVGLLAEHVTEARRLDTTPALGGPLNAPAYLGEMLLEGDALLQMLDVDQLLCGPGSSLAPYFAHAHERGLEASETHRNPAQS